MAVVNLVLSFLNTLMHWEICMVNLLHPNPKHNEIATIGRVRLMLCEHTALALCVLVAADVLDTGHFSFCFFPLLYHIICYIIYVCIF